MFFGIIDRLKRLDSVIIFILLCFAAISTLVIYSATSGTKYDGLHLHNIVMFVVMLIVMLGLSCMDYRFLVRRLSVILYGLGIVLLLVVMFKGMTINGSKRWIDLGVMQFQPSELAKIFVILLLARILEQRNGEPLRFFRDLLPLGLITGVPFLIILEQPDLGTSIVFICIFIGMLWIGNVRITHALSGFFGIAAIIGGMYWLYSANFSLFSKIVKPHQLSRIQTFLDPASDPNKSWHVLNSIRAVGAGQMFGEGFKHGQLVQKGYIPYDYADSIYVVIGEEFGFIGSAVLLLLYFVLIYRMIKIVLTCPDLSGRYLIVGVISMFTLQIFENIAMHTGMMPLTGIALPFISYGGSSLMTNMISMGLVLSVKAHSEAT
ncbi:rod shape-determining protein RodA [Paenibacillus tyrfis]|uniref:rod shape-determining protein RodA n=1 Tax=Paenibacillus tyrfis TaxID=1501230 RepID=UPI0009DFABC0|nr:rod shape-determining protein RodA [Paenibacillus tyrfis]